jgi:hypothetical protein
LKAPRREGVLSLVQFTQVKGGFTMKIYELLWKREEKSEDKKDGKTRWENVGVLIENDGKRSVKINVLPVGDWDGWLTVVERKEKPGQNEAKSWFQTINAWIFLPDSLPEGRFKKVFTCDTEE